jgi:predicted 3-demethylubiquinone-9 3-methyltransferase (glyoxalase superfamily)
MQAPRTARPITSRAPAAPLQEASMSDSSTAGSATSAAANDLRIGDISACLWFRSEAEEAAQFYVSLLPGSRITSVMRGAPGAPPIAVSFTLGGRAFLALNGRQDAGFTDACSFVVPCETQADIDRVWEALTQGGAEGRCGWCTDRFGVSWQVVPGALGALLGGSDRAASGRAMQAMMGMRKMDIAALEAARRAA